MEKPSPATYAVVQDQIPQRSLRDVYYVLFRHKSKMILFFCAVVIVVTLGTFLAPEIYRSEAQLLVRVGRESVTLDPTAATGQIISIGQNRKSEINSELEILKSRELVEKVVDAISPAAFLRRPDEAMLGAGSVADTARNTLRETRREVRAAAEKPIGLLERLDLRHPLSDREKAVLSVTKNLDIEALRDSNMISISYQAQSPRLAQDVVTKLIGFYLDKHIDVHRTPGSYAFFSQQTKELRTKLAKTEEELRKLKSETGIASLDDQRRSLLDRIRALHEEAERTDAALAASRAKVEAMQGQLAKLPMPMTTQETKGLPNWAADGMRERLYELQLKEQELLSKFAEQSEPVREVRRQIAEARKLLDEEERTRTQLTTGVNAAYQQMELALLTEKATLSSLVAKADALKAQLASAGDEVQQLIDNEIRLVRLERERDIQETNYRKYSDNLEQARIDQALEIEKISNISIVQSATLPIKPVRPRKLLNLALGLFLGIFGGIGLAFFSEYVDHSLKTPEDIEERLGLATLVSIPRVSASKAALTAKRRSRVKTSAR